MSQTNVVDLRAHQHARGVEPWARKWGVADHFRVSERTVERWQARGMPYRKVGPRLVLFRISECERWVDEQDPSIGKTDLPPRIARASHLLTSMEQWAARHGRSLSWAYTLMREGMPWYHLRGHRVVLPAEADRWLERKTAR